MKKLKIITKCSGRCTWEIGPSGKASLQQLRSNREANCWKFSEKCRSRPRFRFNTRQCINRMNEYLITRVNRYSWWEIRVQESHGYRTHSGLSLGVSTPSPQASASAIPLDFSILYNSPAGSQRFNARASVSLSLSLSSPWLIEFESVV